MSDEQRIYDRCIIRVGQLEEENEKLRELVRDLYRDLAAILGDGLWMEPYESEMMELEVDA